MPHVAPAQLLTIAELTLSGHSDGQIATALDINPDDLATIRKQKRYKTLEAKLAAKILESAAGRLQALATTAVARLESIIKLPVRNLRKKRGTGEERKVADPLLVREVRVACTGLLNMALKIKGRADEERREEEMGAIIAAEDDG